MKNRELLTRKLTNYFETSPFQEIIFPLLKNDLMIKLLSTKDKVYEYCKLVKEWMSTITDVEASELAIYYYVEHLDKNNMVVADTKESFDDVDNAEIKKQYFKYIIDFKGQKLKLNIFYIAS